MHILYIGAFALIFSLTCLNIKSKICLSQAQGYIISVWSICEYRECDCAAAALYVLLHHYGARNTIVALSDDVYVTLYEHKTEQNKLLQIRCTFSRAELPAVNLSL